MSGSNEWELLAIAEDIEQGDSVVIDDEGEEIEMIFVKYERGAVHLRSGDVRRKFRAVSLEEADGTAYILRKAD